MSRFSTTKSGSQRVRTGNLSKVGILNLERYSMSDEIFFVQLREGIRILFIDLYT